MLKKKGGRSFVCNMTWGSRLSTHLTASVYPKDQDDKGIPRVRLQKEETKRCICHLRPMGTSDWGALRAWMGRNSHPIPSHPRLLDALTGLRADLLSAKYPYQTLNVVSQHTTFRAAFEPRNFAEMEREPPNEINMEDSWQWTQAPGDRNEI